MKKLFFILALCLSGLQAMEGPDKSQRTSSEEILSKAEEIKKSVEVKSLRECALERIIHLITDFKTIESLPFELKEEIIARWGDTIIPYSKGKLLIHSIATDDELRILVDLLKKGKGYYLVSNKDDNGNSLLNALIIQGKGQLALNLVTLLRRNDSNKRFFEHYIDYGIYGANNYKRTPLINALIQQDEALAQELLRHYSKQDINVQDIMGRTALFYALYYLPSLVPSLFYKGASTDIKDKRGETPLDLIGYMPLEKRNLIKKLFENYNIEIPSEASQDLIDLKRLQHDLINNVTTEEDIAHLIENRFDFNATDYEGNTLLNRLLLNNNHMLVRRLFDLVNDLDINSANYLGETPLMNAIAFGYEDSVQEILKRLKDNDFSSAQNILNRADVLKRTPLIYAVLYMPSVIPQLIALGARIIFYQDYVTPLSMALERNLKPEIIELLLAQGAGAYDNKKAQVEIMHQAASNTTYPEVIDLLVKAGFDINHDYGQELKDEIDFPLDVAAHFNTNPAIVQRLIEWGADLGKQGASALLNAARFNRNLKIVELLVDAGVPLENDDYESPLLHQVIKAHNNEIVFYLIEKKGVDINLKDDEGITLLMQAVLEENVPVINYLLDHGADINLTDNQGMTALMWAAQQITNADITQLLLAHNADVSLRDERGFTAFLHAALENSNPIILKMLLQKGAQLNDRNNKQKTALHLAARRNDSPAIMNYLIKKNKGKISDRDYAGNTALHLVWENKNSEVARVLLEHGHELLELKNNKGYTPLLSFIDRSPNEAKKGTLSELELLLISGANVDAQDNNGNTPLMLAIMQRKFWLIDTLLKHNPDLTITNHDGRTAYDLLAITVLDKESTDAFLSKLNPAVSQ